MNIETKNYPTHRLEFVPQTVDHDGVVKQSAPIAVAAIWGRTNGKQGGTFTPDISFKTLGNGDYYLRENIQHGQDIDPNAKPKTYRLSYSEIQSEKGGSLVGRPVEIATTDKNEKVNWKIEPERLDQGVFFVLGNERKQSQDASKSNNVSAQLSSKSQLQDKGLSR